MAVLLNGNLVLAHRVQQLYVWSSVLEFTPLLYTVEPTLKDSWLAGFTDAEGSFNVNFISRTASDGAFLYDSSSLRSTVLFL